jgi:hypothetical protein
MTSRTQLSWWSVPPPACQTCRQKQRPWQMQWSQPSQMRPPQCRHSGSSRGQAVSQKGPQGWVEAASLGQQAPRPHPCQVQEQQEGMIWS